MFDPQPAAKMQFCNFGTLGGRNPLLKFDFAPALRPREAQGRPSHHVFPDEINPQAHRSRNANLGAVQNRMFATDFRPRDTEKYKTALLQRNLPQRLELDQRTAAQRQRPQHLAGTAPHAGSTSAPAALRGSRALRPKRLTPVVLGTLAGCRNCGRQRPTPSPAASRASTAPRPPACGLFTVALHGALSSRA